MCGPCDSSRVDSQGFKSVIRLNTFPRNGNVYLKFENISKKLASNLPSVCMDMLEVASYVYCADQAITRGGKTYRGDGKDWIRNLYFHIPVRELDLWNQGDLRELLRESLGFLSDDNYEFSFSKLTEHILANEYFDFHKEKPWFHAEEISLFSGGLDSLAGAIEELINLRKNVVLVSHRPVAKISSRQSTLLQEFKSMNKSDKQFLHIPVWVNKDQGLTRDTNQRTRSFLYIMLAASVAEMFKLDRIKCYENGVTSSNLPFSGQIVGARATRSTHPKVLHGFSNLLSKLLRKDFKVENPFFSKTKSEVVKMIKDAEMTELVKESCSCTHVRTTDTQKTHCGACSQCIDRRFATLHNHLGDHDPSEIYETDLFLGKLEKCDDKTMVESYVKMAQDLKSMTPEQFYERFGETLRILPYLGLPTSKAAEVVFELHKRHGRQVCEVIDNQIRARAGMIREGKVPPNSLLGMILGRGVKKRPMDELALTFPTPENSTWEDVQIEIKSNESARITVKDVMKVYTAFDMGFRDRRKMDLTNLQWDTLHRFAEGHGVISWGTAQQKVGLYKSIQALKKTLRQFFSIEDSPINSYKKGEGYRTKFKIERT